jgi:hypothetical protein
MMLTSCASAVAGESTTPSSNAALSSPTPLDAAQEAKAKATAWLDNASLPDGAVPEAVQPRTTPSLDTEQYRWWCSPTEEATGFWTVTNTTVAEMVDWLGQHPTPGLVTSPGTGAVPKDANIASVGNVESPESLDGIVYTVATLDDGVGVRVVAGVAPENATCPSFPSGTTIGGPGQG